MGFDLVTKGNEFISTVTLVDPGPLFFRMVLA